MKRLLLAISVVFAFGAMCTGGSADEDDKEVIVVPVPDDGDGEGDEPWCCEYKNDDGDKRYALVEGAAECNSKYADQDGRWVSGTDCTPCCCKAPNDAEDLDKGHSYELTTPTTCAGVGECVSMDGDTCGETDGGGGGGKPSARPSPRPSPRPTGAKRPGAGAGGDGPEKNRRR